LVEWSFHKRSQAKWQLLKFLWMDKSKSMQRCSFYMNSTLKTVCLTWRCHTHSTCLYGARFTNNLSPRHILSLNSTQQQSHILSSLHIGNQQYCDCVIPHLTACASDDVNPDSAH
jgi:hypothetical protein